MTLNEIINLIDFNGLDKDIANNPNSLLKPGAIDAAKSGNMDILVWIAQMYALGTPYIEMDKYKAFRICSYCVENECVIAYNLLGDMYEVGCGVERNFSKALDCWYDGAIKGSPICMYKYAGKNRDRRVYGNGGRLTPLKENTWFKKSADCGYAPACVTIGLAHIRGYYAIPDCKLGVEYLRKAYNMGDTSFMNQLESEISNLYYKALRGDETSQDKLVILTGFKNEISQSV